MRRGPSCEKVDFFSVNETFLDIFGHPDSGPWPLFGARSAPSTWNIPGAEAKPERRRFLEVRNAG